MNPVIALVFCIALVIVLLHIERKQNDEASYALWIPTFWMLICGSRPVVTWFRSNRIDTELDPLAVIETGSSIDRLILGVLIGLALLILLKRNIEWSVILKDNFWLILVFLYMASSILWSDFPYVSTKRWIKASGVIPMALLVLSERKPLQAMEGVLRRSAYVLIPTSLVLIKYYPAFGVAYGRWDGQQMWTGVTTHKNSLGQLCALSVFLLIWALLREWQSGDLFKVKSQAFADALVVVIAVLLLRGPAGSYSATSVGIVISGVATLLLLYRRINAARFIASHLKTLAVGFVSMYLLFYDSVVAIVSPFFGRDTTLTDRTEIWRVLLDVAADNPIFGVGYGSFWGLNAEIYSKVLVSQGHNGYLDVYLELGVVGVLLLSLFLLAFCGRVIREINHVFDWGAFGICFLLMALLYNQTESSFLQTGYMWTAMVLLSVVFSEPVLNTRVGIPPNCGHIEGLGRNWKNASETGGTSGSSRDRLDVWSLKEGDLQ